MVRRSAPGERRKPLQVGAEPAVGSAEAPDGAHRSVESVLDGDAGG